MRSERMEGVQALNETEGTSVGIARETGANRMGDDVGLAVFIIDRAVLGAGLLEDVLAHLERDLDVLLVRQLTPPQQLVIRDRVGDHESSIIVNVSLPFTALETGSGDNELILTFT